MWAKAKKKALNFTKEIRFKGLNKSQIKKKPTPSYSLNRFLKTNDNGKKF